MTQTSNDSLNQRPIAQIITLRPINFKANVPEYVVHRPLLSKQCTLCLYRCSVLTANLMSLLNLICLLASEHAVHSAYQCS
jgi:hypothetical protein